MTHTVDSLMALHDAAVDKAIGFSEHGTKQSAEIASKAKAALHAALTEALAPQAAQPVGINGLTEAETSASISVMGLSKPKAAQPAVQIIYPSQGGGAGGSAEFGAQVGEITVTHRSAAQPVREPLPAHEIVTLYAECPRSDAEMIEFAREVERAHGIGGEK